jgi:flagellar motility protein MotE (MotC chaperone)
MLKPNKIKLESSNTPLAKATPNASKKKKSAKGLFVILLILILAVAAIILVVPNAKKTLLKGAASIPLVKSMLPTTKLKDTVKPTTKINKASEIPRGSSTPKQTPLQIEPLKDSSHIQQAKEIAKTYASMPPSKAATIMDKLSMEEVVYAMTEMSAQERSQIWSKMDPQKVADLSILVKSRSSVTDHDIALMQQRIHKNSTKDIQNQSIEELLHTYSNMPLTHAAKLIHEMMNSDSKRTLLMLNKMDNHLRAQILTVMSSDTAMISTATKISEYFLQK